MRLLKALVVVVVEACVLEAIDDNEVWAALLLKAYVKVFHTLTVKDKEAPVDIAHLAPLHIFLKGEPDRLLKGVVGDLAVLTELSSELHSKGALAVCRLSPDEPHPRPSRLAEGFPPAPLEGDRRDFLCQHLAGGVCSCHRYAPACSFSFSISV